MNGSFETETQLPKFYYAGLFLHAPWCASFQAPSQYPWSNPECALTHPTKPLLSGLQETMWVLSPLLVIQTGRLIMMFLGPTIFGPFRVGTSSPESVGGLTATRYRARRPTSSRRDGRNQYSKWPWVGMDALTRMGPFAGFFHASDPDWPVGWPLGSLIRSKQAVPARQRVGALLHYSMRNPQAASFLNHRPKVPGYTRICRTIVQAEDTGPDHGSPASLLWKWNWGLQAWA